MNILLADENAKCVYRLWIVSSLSDISFIQRRLQRQVCLDAAWTWIYRACVGGLLCQQSVLIKMNEGTVLLRNRVMKSDQSSNISAHVSFIQVTDALSAADTKQEVRNRAVFFLDIT